MCHACTVKARQDSLYVQMSVTHSGQTDGDSMRAAKRLLGQSVSSSSLEYSLMLLSFRFSSAAGFDLSSC